VRTWKAQDIPLADFPALHAWYDLLKQRPGLRRGVALGSERINKRPQDSAETRRILFGIKEQDT
jgi:GSH-dependent disulfide-bond oxidoreductase